MATVIIFGPTGHVGSVVALSAHSFGAGKVVLAMRDTTKAIPGLTPTLEASKNFQRIQADLSNPASIATAITATGATRAFLYNNFASPDHMRSAIEALKSSGIEFVVFLSTGLLRRGTDLAALQADVDPITWTHAQVELNLHDVFGKQGYVSIRPAFFATNAIGWWKKMISSGKVQVFAPDIVVDWVTPDDIGKVSCAIMLAGRVKEGDEEAVWMIGPQTVSLRDGIIAISKAAFPEREQIEIEELDAERGVQVNVANGVPQLVAQQLIKSFGKLKQVQAAGGNWLPVGEELAAAVSAVEKYTGSPAMKLAEWIDKYKGEFRD